MTLTLTRDLSDGTEVGASTAPEAPTPSLVATRLLGLAGMASLGAGTVHAAAVAAHSEHRQAVWTFTSVAVLQLAWGTAALTRPRRWLAVVGIGLGASACAGWVLAKVRGISFVEGLELKEPTRLADGLAAGLALTVIVGAALSLVTRRHVFPRSLTAAAGLAILAVSAPGVGGAVGHPHGNGHALPDGTVQVASAVPPVPFDPALPIDLGGVEGVTPQQQARAENLLATTLVDLPQWSDAAYAQANGFRSIGDGATGTEHFVNPAFMENDTILDPDEPESLVFDTSTGTKRLVAAMYMMPPGTTLEDVPDIGGALTQWHIHNNLCFNADGRVAGLTDGEGGCPGNLLPGPQTPMIHVWIESRPCGPFSALEGIGGGQIAEGESIACDALHGS